MSRRGITVLGLAAAGGVGYYLYNAGGDPKVAQKNIEADARKAQAKVTSDASTEGKKGEKKGEEFAQRAGSQFDKTVSNISSDAKSGLDKAENKAEEYRQKTGKAIDKFDKTVEDKAAQAKSGVSSWFGGSK